MIVDYGRVVLNDTIFRIQFSFPALLVHCIIRSAAFGIIIVFLSCCMEICPNGKILDTFPSITALTATVVDCGAQSHNDSQKREWSC